MGKSMAETAFELAAQAKWQHLHGEDPCMVCWDFFTSQAWVDWLNEGHDPAKHPCRIKERLDIEVDRTCDDWINEEG